MKGSLDDLTQYTSSHLIFYGHLIIFQKIKIKGVRPGVATVDPRNLEHCYSQTIFKNTTSFKVITFHPDFSCLVTGIVVVHGITRRLGGSRSSTKDFMCGSQPKISNRDPLFENPFLHFLSYQ